MMYNTVQENQRRNFVMKKRVIVIIIAALAVIGVVTGIIVGTSVKRGDSAGTSASESMNGTSGAQTSESSGAGENSGAGGNSEEGKESKITETEHTWEISSRTAENLTITTVYVCKTCGETKTETISGKEAVMAMLKASADNTQKAENITLKFSDNDSDENSDRGTILVSIASDGRLVIDDRDNSFPQDYYMITPVEDGKFLYREINQGESGKGLKHIFEGEKMTFENCKNITVWGAYEMLSANFFELSDDAKYSLKIENNRYLLTIDCSDESGTGVFKYVFDENFVYAAETYSSDQNIRFDYKLEFNEETYKKADEFLSSLQYDEEE